MKLSINSYFDDQTGEFIAEKYFIDGNEVSEEDYDLMLEEFDEVNCLENEIDPCEGCECRGCCEEEEGFDYEDLLDIFVDKIMNTGGCPGCIKDILDEFACIFLPDDEDDEVN